MQQHSALVEVCLSQTSAPRLVQSYSNRGASWQRRARVSSRTQRRVNVGLVSVGEARKKHCLPIYHLDAIWTDFSSISWSGCMELIWFSDFPPRDLSFCLCIAADLSMPSHVQRTVAGGFAVLRQLRSVRRSVPSSVFQTLIVSLVLTKLDFGNATLSGLPTNLLNRLQSVLNAAARVARRSTSLRSRHWHSCQFSLASCSWAHQFQTGGPCIPSSARHCTSIPVWPSSPRCWLAVSSSSTVGDFQPTWCPPIASRNCRRPFICLCWAKALEQSP